MATSKIREVEAVLGSGARNNKYRVIFPYFGRELDIQTHDVTAPGRSMGVAEVYLKGRKYQLAGDRSDEGSITLTFYNDPHLIIRRFFLQVVAGIQNYNLPLTIDGAMPDRGTDVMEIAGNIGQRAMIAFDEIRNNFKNIGDLFQSLTPRTRENFHIDLKNHYSKRGSGIYQSAPWYQTDIRVQQLDHNGQVTAESVYHSAFITDVSTIDYQDEIGDVSTTTLTLAYTGASFGEDAVTSVNLART